MNIHVQHKNCRKDKLVETKFYYKQGKDEKHRSHAQPQEFRYKQIPDSFFINLTTQCYGIIL